MSSCNINVAALSHYLQLVFTCYLCLRSFNIAAVQALWTAALLGGKLALPSEEKMREGVALSVAWRRRRYLEDGYNAVFEHVQYMNMLVRDLGLNDERKEGGWKELLSPYTSADWKRNLEEWR
jgi:dimethylaniline monooxygenase (N-oxide forming)